MQLTSGGQYQRLSMLMSTMSQLHELQQGWCRRRVEITHTQTSGLLAGRLKLRRLSLPLLELATRGLLLSLSAESHTLCLCQLNLEDPQW